MGQKAKGLLDEMKFLTNFDYEQYPYILTKEDEQAAIDNALLQEKNHFIWKMKGLGYTEQHILLKLSDIDFNKKIDREKVLEYANSNKNYDRWQKEKREAEIIEETEKRKRLAEDWTAKKMFSLMKWASKNVYGKDLIVNDDNRVLISALCFFISRDDRFESELGFSKLKGLLIRGISGIGKTHLVKCISENSLNKILVLSMIEIADTIKSEGEFNIPSGNYSIIYLDDVGTEESTVNYYGNKINFFKNFIETVYLRNCKKGFSHLIISTNNSFSEIEEKYGFRVRSRMKEMFNVIDVKGNDMRC